MRNIVTFLGSPNAPPRWRSMQPLALPAEVAWPVLPFAPGHFLAGAVVEGDSERNTVEIAERLRIEVATF